MQEILKPAIQPFFDLQLRHVQQGHKTHISLALISLDNPDLEEKDFCREI